MSPVIKPIMVPCGASDVTLLAARTVRLRETHKTWTYLSVYVRHEYAHGEHRQHGPAGNSQNGHRDLYQRSHEVGAQAQRHRHDPVEDDQEF